MKKLIKDAIVQRLRQLHFIFAISGILAGLICLFSNSLNVHFFSNTSKLSDTNRKESASFNAHMRMKRVESNLEWRSRHDNPQVYNCDHAYVEQHIARLKVFFRNINGLAAFFKQNSDSSICVNPYTGNLIVTDSYKELQKEHEVVLSKIFESDCASFREHKLLVEGWWSLTDITYKLFLNNHHNLPRMDCSLHSLPVYSW